MRFLTAACLLTAIAAATPALAATGTSKSWEGAASESQKQGPYSSVRSPSRSWNYTISNTRSYRAAKNYRTPYRGVWDY